MKEAITKFDLEAAFKALDEIDIPNTGKVKANRPALNEIFSRKTKFDSLMEEYYDVSNPAELGDAQDAREAEVAKAKLARIEKIVDLDADSPEDLLTSYVGKYIIQCPQCMTLFYKDPEDVVETEDDPDTVNANEICQHCGNESGYTLIGKVGEAEPGEFAEETPELAVEEEELPTEEVAEEPTEELPTEEEDLSDLDTLDLNLEDEEDKKEESFSAHEGDPLVEELVDGNELEDKLDDYTEYIKYLGDAIAQEQDKLNKATNEQIKATIQKTIDTLDAELKQAFPDANKIEQVEETSADDVVDTTMSEPTDNASTVEEEPEVSEAQEESYVNSQSGEQLVESLKEEAELDVSADEFTELINSPEFKKPISDAAAEAIIDAEETSEVTEAADKDTAVKENDCLEDTFVDLDDVDEATLESLIANSLVEAYSNVAGFRLTECSYNGNEFAASGTIYFVSGNTRQTTYSFSEVKLHESAISLRGVNTKLGLDKQFTLTGRINNKTLITESFVSTK